MFRRPWSRARRARLALASKPARNRLRSRALSIEPLEERPLLAAFTVTNLGDTPVAAAGDAPGTLRQAIFDANKSGGGDSIEFADSLNGTIILTAGELLISEALTINGPGANLLIVDASGNDPTPAINNGDGSRVFHINDGLVATNNPVTISRITITGGDANSGGGGIRSLENLTVNDSIITGNSTTDDGAGIFVSTAAGLNSIVRSTISGNVAPTSNDLGGGMYAYTASGGIAITESTFSGNRAYYGGGIFARTVTGSITITSSTLSGNNAGQGGGGLFIRTGSGTSTIAHSTITNNTANADMGVIGTGGGIYAEGTGTLAMRHTVVAGNVDLHPAQRAPDIDATNAMNAPTLNVSFSLVGDNTRSTLVEAQTVDANGNLIGNPAGIGAINAQLAPLADNDGPTQTHALSIGSPAIDAGNPLAIAGVADVPTFDQRGNPFPRIREGNGIGAPRIDIGAFETALLLLPDLFEPNDSIVTAPVLGSESEVTLRNLTIHNEADEDFFKITAHDTGKLSVRALFTQANGDLDMQIVDRFGNQIALSDSTDDDEDLIIPVVAQETYFIRVYGFADATNEYSLEIENFAAPIPTTIHLDPASDLGRLNNDNLTSDITPTFVIQADVLNFADPNDDGAFDIPVLDSAQAAVGVPGIAVQVRIANSTDPTFTPLIVFANPVSPLSPTLYTVTLADPLPDGVYFASANTRVFDGQGDVAGEPDPATGRSDLSVPLQFTIDTMKPNVVFGESTIAGDGLDPASDSGVASQPNTIVDRITSDSTPSFFGAAEANSTVRVFVRNSTGARVLIGETVATPFNGNNPLTRGRWTLTSTIDMNDPLLGFTALDGVRKFEVEAEDIAGNISPGAVFNLADAPQAIADDATTEYTLEVAGLAGSITDLNVDLGITHPHVADLDVFLVSPAGTTVQLFADVGGDGDNFTGTTLDDEATIPIEMGLAPFTGSFIPMELLAAFDGEDPNGIWTLRIVDDMVEDVGTLDSWTLCFQSSLDVFFDTQGPRVAALAGADFDLINPKAGPTPSINEVTISFADFPARTADFLYPAVNQIQVTTPGNYRLVGDRVGNVPITSVIFTDNTVAGTPGMTDVTLVFASPLPDDRYTLTVSDNLRDDADNRLDGEYFGAPTALPSGDGVPKGDFLVQFTVDATPELGVWAASTVLIDANGNFASDPIGAGGDLAFHLGFSSDYIFAGNFAAIGGAADGFDKLAAYGRVGNQFRWLIDLNNDGVPDLNIVDPAGINGIPVAGNFDGDETNGDEVGIFTGNAWHLDTNHDFRVDSMYTTTYGGFPFVGDFDGDGDDDLGTYVATQSGGNRFFIDLNAPAPGGRLHVDGSADRTFRVGVPQLGSGFFGFPGVRERPVAADMNGDLVDDIGLWVPDGAALVPGDLGEWFFLVSDNDPATPAVENTVIDRIDNGFVSFTPIPFDNDVYAQFGNSFALPVVGNFDPPGTANSAQNARPSTSPIAGARTTTISPQPPTTTRAIGAPAAVDSKELVGASTASLEPTDVEPKSATTAPVNKSSANNKTKGIEPATYGEAAKSSQPETSTSLPSIVIDLPKSVVAVVKPPSEPSKAAATSSISNQAPTIPVAPVVPSVALQKTKPSNNLEKPAPSIVPKTLPPIVPSTSNIESAKGADTPDAATPTADDLPRALPSIDDDFSSETATPFVKVAKDKPEPQVIAITPSPTTIVPKPTAKTPQPEAITVSPTPTVETTAINEFAELEPLSIELLTSFAAIPPIEHVESTAIVNVELKVSPLRNSTSCQATEAPTDSPISGASHGSSASEPLADSAMAVSVVARIASTVAETNASLADHPEKPAKIPAPSVGSGEMAPSVEILCDVAPDSALSASSLVSSLLVTLDTPTDPSPSATSVTGEVERPHFVTAVTRSLAPSRISGAILVPPSAEAHSTPPDASASVKSIGKSSALAYDMPSDDAKHPSFEAQDYRTVTSRFDPGTNIASRPHSLSFITPTVADAAFSNLFLATDNADSIAKANEFESSHFQNPDESVDECRSGLTLELAWAVLGVLW